MSNLARAESFLATYGSTLDRHAGTLLERETLSEPELAQLAGELRAITTEAIGGRPRP